MFYDSQRFRESGINRSNINNPKGIKNPLSASVPSAAVPYFTYIANTRGNESKKLRIPFKYELNDTKPRLSSKSSLNFRSNRNDSDSNELLKKQSTKPRSPSSMHIRVQSSTVSDNVIRSLDITSYSFHSERNDLNETKTDLHSKSWSRSDSHFTPRSKISYNKNIDQNCQNSAKRKISGHSSDGFIINKIIRGTFHSQNEMQKIKQSSLDESLRQDVKRKYKNLFKTDEERSSNDNYRNYLRMKFSNNEKLTGTHDERQIFQCDDESKLYYELAYEQSQRNYVPKRKVEINHVFEEEETEATEKG